MATPAGTRITLSAVAAVLAALSGIVAFTGWALQIPVLKSLLPQWSQMSALSSLAFICAGLSLLAEDCAARGTLQARTASRLRRLASLLAAAILLIAVLRLSSEITGWTLARDSLWFARQDANVDRMAPATAIGFLLIAVGLIAARQPHPVALQQSVAISAGLLGWLGASRYLYGGEPLAPFASMTAHTAMLFLMLSIGLLALRRDTGFMALLSGDTQGSAIARRLVPAMLIVPVILGWLRLQGQRAGWYGTEAGVSLLAIGNMLFFGVLAWISLLRLNRSELDRRDADSKERETQQLLQAVADHSPAVIYVKDLAGRYLFVNHRFGEIFARTRESIIGRTDHELFSSEIAGAFRRMDEQAAQMQQPLIVEEVAPLPDGLHIYLSSKTRLLDLAGKVHATVGVSTDITERKNAEAALRESEERFRTLAESLPQLVWTCRPDGDCDFLSHQWVTYTGRPVAEQLGSGWVEHVHEEDRARLQEQWQQALRSGEIFDTEFRLRRADGAYRWFRTRALALLDGLGKVAKWFGSNTDVDDYKRSEARLRTQLAHLNLLDRTTRAIADRQDFDSIAHAVLRSMEDHLPADFGCVFVCDRTRDTLSVLRVGPRSLALAAELGLSEQSVIEINGNGLSRCVRGEVVYEPDVSQVSFPFPQRMARCGLRAFVAAPLVVEGQVFGMMVIARREIASFESTDCEFLRQLSLHVGLAAHQAQLYNALQHAYDDLRETQKAVLQQERLRVVGQMASGIAHDINNALSPAALYVESLLETDKSLSPRARGYLTVIDKAIDDVAKTVGRLREFYRPLDAEVRVAVDVNSALQRVLELTRVRWQDMPQERGIVIRTQLEIEPALPMVSASDSELRDAITNLVLNAVDAMPEGGVLTLRSRHARVPASDERGMVIIEVCDTGVGMEEEARTRCIEPFFTTKGERGTGLGLAMVYGTVQRLGGEIAIESEPGKGTTMRLFLPAMLANAAGPQIYSPTPVVRQLRLLLVDDDPLLRETLTNILREDGHDIIAADGGQAGIDAFRGRHASAEPIAVVITDLGMPYVDGRKVAAEIKALSPRTPVILLTGWGHRLLSENDIPENVDRVLGKPPRLAELRAALAETSRAPRA